MVRRILVTGGAGFIGHHLVRRLGENGRNQITIIDNLSNANRHFDPARLGPNVKFYKQDIRNRQAVSAIVRNESVDSCVHLAAKVSVQDSFANPIETVEVNVGGILSVLDACANNNVESFILASTAAVYGNAAIVPTPEDHVLQPVSTYGASKVAAEAFVNSYYASGRLRKAITLRLFNVYGEGQSPGYAGVITRFLERISQGLPPIIFGNGKQTRDFVSVADVINSIESALDVANSATGTYNIGTGHSISLNELSRQIMTAFGLKGVKAAYAPPQKGDIMHSCADINKAAQHLSLRPSQSIAFEQLARGLMILPPEAIDK